MKPTTHVLALLSALSFLSTNAQAEDESWADQIQLSGDLRLRYEQIKRETRETRKRSRYRARLALTADVSDNVKLIFEIASGADNPVSRNVTFDGGFSAEDIGFDLVYVDWIPIEGMHVFGGKMKNPLFRAGNVPLIWDSDLNPDGVAVAYSRGVFFGTLGSFFVEERETGSNSFLLAVQVGARVDIGKMSTLTAGVGYFGYSNTVGNEPFHNGEPKGNSVDPVGNYLYEYKDAEFFSQFDTRVGSLPLVIYAHWVRNNEVSEQDIGIAFGAKLGSAKTKGRWEFAWTYQDIEADAIIGTFNDSDFGGGGTDSNGHIIRAKYAVSSNIFVGGRLSINKINPFRLPQENYDRLQLDVELKFN